MKLSEILDTTILVKWEQNGKFELAAFTVDVRQYIMQLETMSLPFDELVGKRGAEASFFRNDKVGDMSFSTTKEESIPLQLYGAVANAFAEKFSEYDAFYFSAEMRHSASEKEFDTKKKIYRLMADKIHKRTGAFFYEKEVTGASEFLVSRVRITSPGFRILAEEAALSIDWTQVPNVRDRK